MDELKLAEWNLYWTAGGVVVSLLGAIASTVIAWYAIYHDSFWRPKLILDFENDKDVKRQRNTVGLPDSTKSSWLRFRVSNAPKRRMAKNCRAYIVRIEGSGEQTNSYELEDDTRVLLWQHGKDDEQWSRDILPGVVHRVDLCGAIENEDSVRVCCYPKWSMKAPGTYTFTVQVSAEDAEPATIKIRVDWRGDWTSLAGKRV